MCPFWHKPFTLENGANWANHPGTVISNLGSFPRNDTRLEKLRGKQQFKVLWLEGSSGTNYLPLWKGVCTRPFFSHQEGLSFQGVDGSTVGIKLRIPLRVGVSIVSAEGSGKNVLSRYLLRRGRGCI